MNYILQVQTCSNDRKHHDQHLAVQLSLVDQVESLVTVFEELRNPFVEKDEDLSVLDTRDVLDKSVGEAVRKAIIPKVFRGKAYQM